MPTLEKLLRLFESSYLAGFQGRGFGSSMIVEPDVTMRLPKQPCRFAMLSNFSVLDVPVFSPKADAGSVESDLDDETEVYWGFNGRIIGQLFAGKSTEIFPISDLGQISVRTRPGETTTIWFAWWV